VGMTRGRPVVTGVGVVATTVGVPVRIEIREGARFDTVIGCGRVCVFVCVPVDACNKRVALACFFSGVSFRPQGGGWLCRAGRF
jgi:hypothetical protein